MPDLRNQLIEGRHYPLEGGLEVLVYTTHAPGPFPIHGRILGGNAGNPTSWNGAGKWSGMKALSGKAGHPYDFKALPAVVGLDGRPCDSEERWR